MHAVVVERTGGPEVLTWKTLEDEPPGEGQVLVDVAASGVNFIDTYHRSGLYTVPLPAVLGVEGAGTVAAVGPGVTDVRVGDRVAWADEPRSYATQVVVAADRTVPVPDDVDLATAAAVLLQGLTAHYLTRDTYRIGPGDRCLVHAAAGGVGLLLVQFATLAGAEVFATVGSVDKADLAREAGADHVVVSTDEDFADAVTRIAGPRPLDVVYDGIGRATFARGLGLLRRRGVMATFGNASGPVDPVPPLDLMRGGSLYLTRPMLADHVVTTDELRGRAGELLGLVGRRDLAVRIGHRLPLDEAGQAHRLLESRATTGKVLLTT